MKNLYTIIALLISFPIVAQTGIGTTTPNTTLEVAGDPTNTSVMDGIIPPKITGDQLAAKTYTASQQGAIVYVTAAPGSQTGQVVNVNQAGIYAFNGSAWVKLAATAIGFIPSVTATGQSIPFTEFQPTGIMMTLTNEISILTGTGLDASGTFTAAASGFYQINIHGEYKSGSGQTISLAIGTFACLDPCTDSYGIFLSNFSTRGGSNHWNSLNASGILYLNAGESIGPMTLFRGGGTSFDPDHRIRNFNVVVQHIGE
jgi:hypothetical protein